MKQIVIHDFSELKYLMKSGKAPEPVKEKHTGNWNVVYGNMVLEYNLTYGQCVQKTKDYKMMGARYPNKDKFSIKPYNPLKTK